MRFAQFEDMKRKDDEFVVLTTIEEFAILRDALEAFCAANKRKVKAAALLKKIDAEAPAVFG